MLSPKENQQKIVSIFQQLGLDHYGFCQLQQGISFDYYRTWIQQEKYGSMHFLVDHLQAKEDPKKFYKNGKSVIVIGKTYHPHPKENKALSALKIAKYACGDDYHFWFRQELTKYANKLQKCFPENEFLCFTDSAPILERDYAKQAGLGWIGKNTCIIHPKKGSFFFLGEILTDLKVLPTPIEAQIPDRCGTCTRCIDACPTGALHPQNLDANKCISYWNIEAKNTVPNAIREQYQSWYFGCDICQDICPWNEKIFGKIQYNTNRELQIKELKFVLTSSNKALERYFKASPLSRAKPSKHKATAIILCVENKYTELIRYIEEIKTENPTLLDIKEWALKRLTKNC